MTYALIFWWWVWSLGVYWDDQGWSLYVGPLELRVSRPSSDWLPGANPGTYLDADFDFREDS